MTLVESLASAYNGVSSFAVQCSDSGGVISASDGSHELQVEITE
jgi:hypothetical protein